MSFQPISLGTPNNNDGDSLYAGGVKLNANFAELYTALAGSSGATIKIAVGTSPLAGTTFNWITAQGVFAPSSSDALRTLGNFGYSGLYITNNAGVAGNGNSDLTGAPNTQYLYINGRQVMNARARVTSSLIATRAEFNFGLGLTNVTSVSIYTTSLVIRGSSGLEVYKALTEDTASYTPLLLSPSTSTGIVLYQQPSLDFGTMAVGVRGGTDSSNAIAHTGFVALNLTKYPLSSTVVNARRGLLATASSLSTSISINIDGIYHPKHIEGLIYNYDTTGNKITLVTGAAAHWSYSTSGVAGIDGTTAIAIVASYSPITRTFDVGWTPDYNAAGSTYALIDSTVKQDTWYYLYYVGCLRQHTYNGQTFYPGSSNVVLSSNRDIASVDAQLNAAGWGPAGPNGYWQVVRRLGPVKTDAQASPRLRPFNIKRIDHGGFEYYWGLEANAWGGTALGLDSNYYTTGQIPPVYNSSATVALSAYTSSLLTQVPPLPGITAMMDVAHRPSAVIPFVALYGDTWTKNANVSTPKPPFQVIRHTTSGVTNRISIQLPMSPDGCYIPDGTYGGAGILEVFTTSVGQYIRYAMFAGDTSTGVISTPAYLAANGSSYSINFIVSGFRIAR